MNLSAWQCVSTFVFIDKIKPCIHGEESFPLDVKLMGFFGLTEYQLDVSVIAKISKNKLSDITYDTH